MSNNEEVTSVTNGANNGQKQLTELTAVTIRFAGDSGDGMQLTGSQFTDTTAIFGNDIGTLPDFPAEIRAPVGTTYGVSGFQLQFSSNEVHTPGDEVDILVAMNPAALKVNVKDLKKGGVIIVNSDSFDKKGLQLAGYTVNPLEDETLHDYEIISIPITKTTLEVLKELHLSQKAAVKCKNFFALGLMYWLYERSMEGTLNWIDAKFSKDPLIAEANKRALKAGYNFGETSELFSGRYQVRSAKLPSGTYRSVSGNEALALGLVSASVKSGLKLMLATYPITPASDILHYLSKYKNFGIITFQAEDEIASVTAAIGASFAGGLGVTSTSGPGVALKTEAIGLAVMTELPLLIINVQRGGPSTGLPTKTEQADLMQAIYGRNGECPVAVIAPSTPSDCFNMAYEAVRIATQFMTPVMYLSDGFLANGSEPWKVITADSLPELKVNFRTEAEGFFPYLRDENLARPWAVPGTPGLEHRIGGLEKQNITGNVNYDPDNHENMVKIRAQKIKNIQNIIPKLEVNGDQEGELLVLGWGSTYGAIIAACENARAKGKKVSYTHLRYLNPMPSNIGEVLRNFKKVLIPEMNLGQLSKIIRAEFLVDAISLNKVQGLPFKAREIEQKIIEILGE